MIVVNLFGVPGAGKSTGSAYIFSKLKMKGINAELVTEFAKDKVWENNKEPFKNQAYLFGKQSYRISRCRDKVDVIVTDSPLPLSIFYNNDPCLTENFTKSVMDVFNSYNNLNYLLLRTKLYNPKGRLQTEKESDAFKEPMVRMLKMHDIHYLEVDGDLKGYDWIVQDILKKIKKQKQGMDKINISKAEYEVKTTMTNDLLKAEEYINTLGVATRELDNDDEFRSMYDVLSDIVTVWNNNPTIGKDAEEFLGGNPETSDETEEFLSHYNLDGIMRNR